MPAVFLSAARCLVRRIGDRVSLWYPKNMSPLKSILLIAGAILVLLAGYLGFQLFTPVTLAEKELEVEIPQGSSFRQALSILSSHQLIGDATLFLFVGKMMGVDKRIRAGFYSFSSGMTPWEVFGRLRTGKIVEREVTILEGDSLPEIREKLVAKKIMSAERYDTLIRDGKLLSSIEVRAPSLEGYLFPQTYRFPKGMDAEQVFRHMVQMMRHEFSDEMRKRAAELGWSENQVLTLASIIEKEAQLDKERPVVSAVYHNRIIRGMPLQADPTAIYGVKDSRQKITKKDLRRETPFNTYVIKGLPPGPIASPGLKSIQAALYPANVTYLYFVARGDGTHIFSNTLSEHEAAIRRVRSAQEEG